MGGRTKHDDRRAAIPVALAVPFAFACALVCNDAIAADASAAPVSTAPATSAPVLPATSTKRTSSLSWVRLPGAESCLAASELSTRVEAKLGRAVFVSPSVADLAIEARAEIEPKTRQFRVVVKRHAARRTRARHTRAQGTRLQIARGWPGARAGAHDRPRRRGEPDVTPANAAIPAAERRASSHHRPRDS